MIHMIRYSLHKQCVTKWPKTSKSHGASANQPKLKIGPRQKVDIYI